MDRTLAATLAGLMSIFTSPRVSFAQSDEKPANIPALVRDLGSDCFRTRENAQRELAKIGPKALPALKNAVRSSDLEVRWRARQLIELWRTEEFYAISEEGRLFRLTVGKQTFACEDIAKLGEPFDRPDVCVEGLAMSRQGMLYASVVFRSDATEMSLLYRIDPTSGATRLLGLILPAQVTGLDFGPDGRLYGVLSSCRHSSLTGQTQLVEIDSATGKASATPTAITHRNLNGLAIDKMGRAILSNGSCGLFQVELKPQSHLEPYLADEYFCAQMAGAELEGLCYGQGGELFGLSHSCRQSDHFLVQFDPTTGRLVRVAKLNFAARNLAAVKETHPVPDPAVAERAGS